MEKPSVSEMPQDFWAWTASGKLVPLGVFEDYNEAFERADARAPGSHWVFSREGLEEFRVEVLRELPIDFNSIAAAAPKMRQQLESIIEWTNNETNMPMDRLLYHIRQAARFGLQAAGVSPPSLNDEAGNMYNILVQLRDQLPEMADKDEPLAGYDAVDALCSVWEDLSAVLRRIENAKPAPQSGPRP